MNLRNLGLALLLTGSLGIATAHTYLIPRYHEYLKRPNREMTMNNKGKVGKDYTYTIPPERAIIGNVYLSSAVAVLFGIYFIGIHKLESYRKKED